MTAHDIISAVKRAGFGDYIVQELTARSNALQEVLDADAANAGSDAKDTKQTNGKGSK